MESLDLFRNAMRHVISEGWPPFANIDHLNIQTLDTASGGLRDERSGDEGRMSNVGS